jgi:hypothetical protein
MPKFGKLSNIKVLRRKKNTGPKHDSQNRLRLLTPERGEIIICNGEYIPTVTP